LAQLDFKCAKDDAELAKIVQDKMAVWQNHLLKDAQKRLAKQIEGYNFTMEDAKDMMDVSDTSCIPTLLKHL